MSRVAECPQCRQRFNLPDGGDALALKCPRCAVRLQPYKQSQPSERVLHCRPCRMRFVAGAQVDDAAARCPRCGGALLAGACGESDTAVSAAALGLEAVTDPMAVAFSTENIVAGAQLLVTPIAVAPKPKPVVEEPKAPSAFVDGLLANAQREERQRAKREAQDRHERMVDFLVHHPELGKPEVGRHHVRIRHRPVLHRRNSMTTESEKGDGEKHCEEDREENPKVRAD